MEFDEKTQQYRTAAADITSDDVIAWLGNCPVSAFDNSWFQLTPTAKTVIEQGIWEPKVWDVLRSLLLESCSSPSEKAIREFKAAEERNELSKQHIADVAVIHYLKNIEFSDLVVVLPPS